MNTHFMQIVSDRLFEDDIGPLSLFEEKNLYLKSKYDKISPLVGKLIHLSTFQEVCFGMIVTWFYSKFQVERFFGRLKNTFALVLTSQGSKRSSSHVQILYECEKEAITRNHPFFSYHCDSIAQLLNFALYLGN